MTFCAKWNARKSVKGFTVNKTTAIFADTLSIKNMHLKYCKYEVASRIMVISKLFWMEIYFR